MLTAVLRLYGSAAKYNGTASAASNTVSQVFISTALRDTRQLGKAPLIRSPHPELYPDLIYKSLLSHMDKVIDSAI